MRMAIWNSTFLNKIRDYWKGKIDKIQLKTGTDTWMDLQIISKTIDGNDIVVFTKVPAVTFDSVEIRVIDTDGDVAGATPDAIAKTDEDTFYITFRFTMTQLIEQAGT